MKDQLGNRFKNWFENRAKQKLVKKVPVICRLDGKTFGTFTKRFERPFDENLISMMDQTAISLCNEIQGAKMAYVQSDEISILITDLDKEETEAWFDFSGQKMTSVSASLATTAFNAELIKHHFCDDDSLTNLVDILTGGHFKFANFDSRVFSVAREKDVIDYFIWRMKDAEKNSISMLAQSMFSHKQLEGVNGRKKIEMCQEKGINWHELPSGQKYGRIITKQQVWKETEYPIKDEKFADGSAKQENGKNYVLRSVWGLHEETVPFWEENEYIKESIQPVGD